MSQKLNAVQIKTILIDYLLANYDTEFIATEVPYLSGFRRADLVAMIDNKTVSFEIKSELDSLSKLSKQINDYVVLAEKYRQSNVISNLPSKVGIFYINKNNKILLHRKAKEQKILNPEKLIYFFKKDEMININNIDTNLSLRKIREKFLKMNSIKDIVKYTKEILRNKYLEKYKTFLNEKGYHTIEEDLILLTGKDKNNQILQMP